MHYQTEHAVLKAAMADLGTTFFGTDDCTYYRDSDGGTWLIQIHGCDEIVFAAIPVHAVELPLSVLDDGHLTAFDIIENGR